VQDKAVGPGALAGIASLLSYQYGVLAPHSVVISIKILQLLMCGSCDPTYALQS
jgi:hypothetical protein